MNLIKEMAEKSQSPQEGRSILSLMDKPNKCMLEIRHWHPLSLLNCDSKIFSKVLANRLYSVLDKLIRHDQSGFLKGHYIGENLLDLQSIIEHCDLHQIPGLIVAIDSEKAFDKLKWSSYYEILRAFNFGEKYIGMVKNLFKNMSSCTINNGFSSDWMKITQGLR